MLLLVLGVLLAGLLVLLFGPARGMRNDIGQLSTGLSTSRGDIYGQFGTGREQQLSPPRAQLETTERSLVIQEQGLQVAVAAERDATSAAQATQATQDQTREALTLVREVTQALGPLDQLDEKVDSVVRSVEQGCAAGPGGAPGRRADPGHRSAGPWSSPATPWPP